MKFGRNVNPEEASFDLTPLVDVVMLLIIFFTLTTHFAKTQLAPMDLPREKGQDGSESQQASLTIDLRRDGSLSVMGAEVQMEELLKMVTAETMRSGATIDLIVRAERDGPARHLNRLADALAGVGVKSWKLATSAEGGL
jgi:biopolymer transport protein ExbD